MEKQWWIFLQLALAMIIVGSSVVAGKIMVSRLPVFLSSCLRFAVAVLILLPLWLGREKGLPPISRRDLLLILLQCLTGVFLFNVLLLYGLKYTSALDAGIISSSTPALLGAFSFLFLKEHLRWIKIAAITCTLCGVCAINLNSAAGAEVSAMHGWGNLLVFAAVVGEALFTLLRKLTGNEVSPLANAASICLFAFLMFLPAAVYEARHFNISSIAMPDVLVVLYFGVMVTALSYLLWLNGVMRTSASTAAVFTGLMPVSSVLLSCLVLKDIFTPVHLLGLLCVLLGIILTAFEDRVFVLRSQRSGK